MSVKDFDSDWDVDWQNKIISCHSPNKGTTYTVTDFWRWARKKEASWAGMPYPQIIDTDGMGSSYNIARKVKLTNGYIIDNNSIKHLVGTDSTLLDEHNNVLIPDGLRHKHWWENSLIQGSLILIAIIGLVLAIIGA